MKTKIALELVQQIAQGNIREEVADMLIQQAEEIERLSAKLAEIERIIEDKSNSPAWNRIEKIRKIVEDE